jgi:hypothetical protein
VFWGKDIFCVIIFPLVSWIHQKKKTKTLQTRARDSAMCNGLISEQRHSYFQVCPKFCLCLAKSSTILVYLVLSLNFRRFNYEQENFNLSSRNSRLSLHNCNSAKLFLLIVEFLKIKLNTS